MRTEYSEYAFERGTGIHHISTIGIIQQLLHVNVMVQQLQYDTFDGLMGIRHQPPVCRYVFEILRRSNKNVITKQ